MHSMSVKEYMEKSGFDLSKNIEEVSKVEYVFQVFPKKK